MSSSPDRDAAPELEPEVREALVRRDPDALAAFFDVYFDRVHGYVRRLVREEHLAEDLTQDVFLHVHRSLEAYEPQRPLAPWVFTIATNKVRDHWRSRRHQEAGRTVSTDEDGVGPTLEDGAARPGERLEAEELDDRVARAIEELPEMLRQALVLRYYEGLSFEAIGEIVGRNETAVRKRYSRALQELRRHLAPAPAPESPRPGPKRARQS